MRASDLAMIRCELGFNRARMLPCYTHPTEERKIDALNLRGVVTKRSQSDGAETDEAATPEEIAELLRDCGGRQEARTPDLRVAIARRTKAYLIGGPRRARSKAR